MNPFQYTARESDTETGLYYYRARYYDSATGRFIGEDRVRFPQGPNFYSYVGNNPTSRVDPTGLKTKVCCRNLQIPVLETLGFKHCFIIVEGNKAVNGGQSTSFSLFDLGSGQYPATPMNWPDDLNAYHKETAKCVDVPDCNSCSESKILQNRGDAGPSKNYDPQYPNSNTYVFYQLKKAGCTPPALPFFGVVGYEDWPPVFYPWKVK